VEKKEELDATAMSPVSSFEIDSSGADVLDEVRVGMASSSTVAEGRPALASSRLMMSTVSLPVIASAAPSSAAMMPVSMRTASARRCRRLLMLSIL